MVNATGMRIDYGYFDNDWEHALKTHKPNEALDFVQRAPGGTTIWLLTIIRNFVHQVVSSLFEDFHYNIYGFMSEAGYALGANSLEILNTWKPKLFEAELATMSEDDLMNHLVEQKMMHPQRFNFDFLKPIIGVDLGTVPFDHERSQQFISLKFADGKQINVVGLRYEDLSKWSTILREYFPTFPENLERQQQHEEDLLVERYSDFKEYLDNIGYFNALSLDELRAFPNQNYYTDCEIMALANLSSVVDLTSLPPANSTACSSIPTLAPTPYPMDVLANATTQRKGCTPTEAPTVTPTASPTFGNWGTKTACFDASRPWVRIDDLYCLDAPALPEPTPKPTQSPTAVPTPSPTVQGHWVVSMECKAENGQVVDENNCPEVESRGIIESY
jgi:hypothetical protein